MVTLAYQWYGTIGRGNGTNFITIGTSGITNGTNGRTLNDIGIPLVPSSCFVVFRRLFFVAPGKTGKKGDFYR